MRHRTLPLIVLIVFAIAAANAAAQGQGSAKVTVSGLAPTATIQAGKSHTQTFNVILDASGFQCTGSENLPVDLALSNAGAPPAGVSVKLDPANLTFATEGPKAYGLPQDPSGGVIGGTTPNYNQSKPVTLTITTTAAASGTYTASVTATFKGVTFAPGSMCVGNLPAATGSSDHKVTISGSGTMPTNGTTPTTTPTVTPTMGGNGNETTPTPTPSKGLPGFEPLVVFGGAALAVVLRRRFD